MKTLTKFYLDKDGDIFAVFPNDSRYSNGIKLTTCYAHIGQHSECTTDYLKGCKICKDHQVYGHLLAELRQIGYSPTVHRDCIDIKQISLDFTNSHEVAKYFGISHINALRYMDMGRNKIREEQKRQEILSWY